MFSFSRSQIQQSMNEDVRHHFLHPCDVKIDWENKNEKTRDVLRYQEKNQTKNKIIRNISKKSLCTQLFYDNKESIQILKKYVCAETDIFKSTFKISIMLKKCMYIQKLSNRVRVFTLYIGIGRCNIYLICSLRSWLDLVFVGKV